MDWVLGFGTENARNSSSEPGYFFYLDQVGGIQLSFWTRRARNVFVIYNFFISFCFYFPILRCIDNFVLPFVKAPPYLRLKEKFWLKLYEGKVDNILYSADEPQNLVAS